VAAAIRLSQQHSCSFDHLVGAGEKRRRHVVVGESGPELFIAGRRGTVIPNKRTNPRKSMLRRGRISNKALDERLGSLERLEAKEHRFGGKYQQGINAATR
jgi:hypothetical protein